MERYLRYKRGTEKILSWLAATASKHCDISQLVSALKTKSARQNAAQGGTVELLAGELVGLALSITRIVPPIAIPDNILNALEKTIEGRQAVASIYKTKPTQAGHEHTQEDQGHRHFINILIEIQSHLKQAAEAAAQQFTQSPPHNTNALYEKFTKLDIEDKEEVIEDNEPDQFCPSARTNLSQATFVLGKQDHEDVLACLCFLESLKKVRLAVMETWKQYMKGEVTFIAASMAAHAALCLLNCAEEEFVALNPALDTWHKIRDFLGLELHSDQDQSLLFVVNVDAEGPLSQFIDLDIASLLAVTGYEAMVILFERLALMGRNLQGFRNGKPQIGLSKSKIPFRRRLGQHSFVKMLLENVVLGLWPNVPSFGRQKELVDALGRCYKSGCASTWVAVACQMYVDVLDILGPQSEDGVSIFKQSLRALETNKVVLEVHSRQHPKDAPGLEYAVRLSRDSAALAKDAAKIFGMDTSIVGKGDVRSRLYMEQIAVIYRYQRNPLMNSLEHMTCVQIGCSAYNAKLQKAVAAMCCTDVADTYIHTIAFLYEANRNLGLLPQWPDMDVFIAAQPELKLRPSNADNPRAILETYRTFLKLPSVAALERSLYRPGSNPFGTIAPIEHGAIIAAAFNAFATGNSPLPLNKRLQIFLHRLTTEKLAGLTGSRDGSLEEGMSAKKTSFEPVELLSTFTGQFQSEEPLLNFDYLRLWADCGMLCDKILDEVIRDEHYDELPVLGTATMVGSCLLLSYQTLLERKPDRVTNSPLAHAARIMESHVKSKGDRYIRAAEEQSSGHIPDQVKPSDPGTDLLTDEQTRTINRLRGAGTSVSTSGGVVVMYHTKLTTALLCSMRKPDVDVQENMNIPPFMYDGEEKLPRW
jgi:hypothetical protein